MIAFHSKCKILPVCIQTKNWHTNIFKKTKVRIGKPIEYGELGFTDGKNGEFDKASEYIFSKITDMIED